MQLLLDEAQRSPTRRQWLEIMATFETLQSLILLSFDDNRDVMHAVQLIEDLLLDARSSWQRRVIARRLLSVGAVLLIAATVTIILLSF